MKKYASPLQEAAERFPQTQLWNDSCGMADIDLALSRGGCGATSNPVIVGNVLRKEMPLWEDRLRELIKVEMADATDEEICWQISGEAGLKGAEKLLPLFRESKREKGWQAMQVNPRFYRSTEKTVAHAVQLSSMSENILIKMPVSTADIPAIEECVYRGVSVNGTVCFGVPQAVAVAEAIERGLKRREAEGLSVDGMINSCTIMTGRVDDYMKKLVAERETPVTQEYLDSCGEAIFKKVYKLYKERGYRAKLLVANNNSHFLWSRFLGGDILMTINPVWWRRMEGCNLEIRRTIDEDVDEKIVRELLDKIPEYRQIFEEDGLKVEEFNQFGAFKDTMNEFLTGYDAFIVYLRKYMLP
ncbi:MAG: transaldolase [Lachnospiraceae bacterium]|nr:transaldolase [Lachnospiraceae bacterium]